MCKKWIVLMCLAELLTLGSVASAELVGYWPFDEGAGTTATDATGLNGDGTFTGDVSWTAGVSRSALHFDGNGDYVTLPNNPRTQLRSGGGFTVAAWVKVEKVDNGVIMMVGQGCSTWASWYLGVGGGEPDAPRNEGNLLFATRTSGGSAYNAAVTPLAPDTWVHIAATHDGTTLVLYQDGVEVNRVAAGTPYQNTDPFYIGGDPGCNGRQWFGGSLDELQIYDAPVAENEIRKIMRGNAAISSDPYPTDDADDVPRDIILSWSAGDFAVAHDVYFGTSFADVNNASRSNPMGVLVSQGQTASSYDPPGVLDFETTYYWRVDEVNAAPDNTIFKGEVWSFTAEPFAYPIANVIATSNGTSDPMATAQRTVDGSGIDAAGQASTNSSDMWLAMPGAEPLYIQFEFERVYKLHQMLVWNYNSQFELLLGFGLKSVTIEYSENGTDWTALGDFELARATAKATYTANTTVDFAGVPARYVRLNVNSGYGVMGQYGLSEVRFLYIPAQAREPRPADGATGVAITSALNWRAGREAVSHEVYFGTNPDAMALVGTTGTNSYSPAALDLATTYYWRVDEVNQADAVPVWEGDLWSFTAQEYIVVDDFESYNDDLDAGTTIFDTWIDGWVNDTGSTVGHYNAPFAERSIVHGGRQSMPLFFDNTSVATSEADFSLSANWSANGIRSLSLYFYGAAGNSGQLYVKINGTKITYDGPAVNLVRPSWQLWSIDLSKAGNVSNVRSLTIGIEGAGAKGVVYIDDIRLYPEVLDYISPDITGAGDTVQGVPNDGDWPAAEAPPNAIDDNVTTKYLHHKGRAMPTGFQVAPLVGSTIVTGLTFTSANDDYGRDPTSFELYGSNASINGPYTLIASGSIVDFSQATVWPRYTKTTTPIEFANTVAYRYYQILFPTLRANSDGNMQIAEVEFLGTVAP